MTTRQQRESLEYFSRHADSWRSKAEGLGNSDVNVIQQRNGYVLQLAEELPDIKLLLDIGCGTGELVCDIANRGVEAIGVDYAPEMIELCSKKARDENLDKASFVCSSVFDFEMKPACYDIISAIGFIEYISQQEMIRFFDMTAQALKPGGSFVVGSRNRLFNLVSMNTFTLEEMQSDHSRLLLEEAVKWTNAKNISELGDTEAAPLQTPDMEHSNTGIEVSTRFQYTPLQLIKLLKERGLEAVEVYPVHIHGVTPSFKKANPKAHTSIANLLQSYSRHNTTLLTHASTFMLHVRKSK